MNKEKNTIEVMKPFGPWIAKVNMPEKILNNLNEYIDQVMVDQKKIKKLDLGKKLVGNVKQEFELDANFAKKCGWEDFLRKAASKWIEIAMNKKITEFNMINTWVVRQFANEYNPIHFHSGHISGAGFLKLPTNFGTTVQEGKVNHNGKLELVHGNRQFLSSCVKSIDPKVGDFYLFPHYLMHLVYPFSVSNEERRSIYFNAKIDESIYNVYGTSKS